MFISIIKLCIASLIPVGASLLFFYLNDKTSFANIKYIPKQIILGIIFGLIAVVGTEWGIPLNGVMVNCRDAAPIAAGLLFGGPAGIIAGIIGGVERWIAVAWGVGSFTRVACSVSTVISGFYAALLRKYLFENKRPTWGFALGIGIIMEVFHMCMVFLTNISDATKAISTIDTCFIPMVSAVGLSVMFSTIVVALYEGDFNFIEIKNPQKTPIFETIQRWFLIVLALSFTATIGFDYILQENMSYNNAVTLISDAVSELSHDIEDESNKYMLEHARVVAREISSGYYNLNALSAKYNFTEISVIDQNGIIVESNNPDYVGFDMASGEQSSEFLCLLDGSTTEYTQAYGPTTQDPNIKRKFAGIKINSSRKGFVQVSYDADAFQSEVARNIRSIATNRHVGTTGGIIILDSDRNIVSVSKHFDFASLKGGARKSKYNFKDFETPRKIAIFDDDYYICARVIEGYTILALYRVKDSQLFRDVSVYVSLFSMLLVFAVMFAQLYMLIKKIVVNQITKMAESLDVICEGNLNEVVDVRSNKEFSSLSDDINLTVDTLKRYIAEAAARIDKELEFAKTIQVSAMPTVFPKRDDYEIYAYMRTAKEVGGDFYDFYMTDEDTVNFLIADVSGKGIPAAMFMMRAKAVLRSLTERGRDIDAVFTEGNNNLCSGNDAGMFVTAWQGIMDINSGKIVFANAGHNLPVIKHANGEFAYHKQKINLVLGGMEDLPYSRNELTLEPGDIIFLYTDGVTEATDADNNMFGDERLLNVLNSRDFTSPKEICECVLSELDKFVNGADQFDDITMLALRYDGRNN